MLELYDNTLREGEQSIGISFSKSQKIDILKKQIAAGIKKIEAGFIAVSDYERETLKKIANMDFDARIFSLSRLLKSDIDDVYNIGLRNITVFTSSSDLLMEKKLHTTEEELIEQIKTLVDYCKKKHMYVRFSCEDATNTPKERLIKFYSAAYENGADYASVPDTCGIGSPNSIYDLIKTLKSNVKIPFSIHTHNDFGLALANTIAAYNAGVDEVQATINGFGERAGNCPLSEVVVAMKQLYNEDMGIDMKSVVPLSKTVASYCNYNISPNHPLTGKNVFTCQSGLHVAIMSKDKRCYMPFDPEIIGRHVKISFGKQSGKSNIYLLCDMLGISLDNNQVKKVLERIKELSYEKKGDVSTEEVIDIIKSKKIQLNSNFTMPRHIYLH